MRGPNDANAWATLAMLRFHEHSMMGHNTRATPLERAWEAAERAIEIDSTCIRGWVVLTLMRGRARDLPGLRAAAQRVIEINPLDTSKLAVVAFMLTCAGDIERGEELARRAMSLHSNTAGWYRMPAFYRRFFAGEYPEALQAARLIGIDSLPLTHLTIASAAGQTGSAEDARGAIAALERIDPAWLSVERVRANYANGVWDENAVDRLVEGFEKALVLAGAEPESHLNASAPRPASRPTSSGPSTTRVRSGQSASSMDRDYVVALHPFTSDGSDEESAGLARGLTEDIGTALSRFQTFTVRTSKDADARYVVDGSVRRSGNSVRVSARLVDTDSGANVWAERFDRALGSSSLFDLQDEITSRVVSTIGSAGGPFLKAMAFPLRERKLAELTPHELVLRCYLLFGSLRADEHALLRTALEAAVADQPNHALAWASLGSLYEQEIVWGINPLPDGMGRATRAARRSVEIDPGCQFGWSRLVSTSFYTNDRVGMRNASDRVIALNPLNQNTIVNRRQLHRLHGRVGPGHPDGAPCHRPRPEPPWHAPPRPLHGSL
ncbi:MAG: hypothetical protein KBH14_13230, partial [Vicinamibacteria bacterium]|nr:hypothetical protein [Vicinamibacteria bacterium]